MKASTAIATAALAAALAVCLAGCSLMPAEEVLPDAPVVRKNANTQFTMTYVQRGDLIETKRYTASYKAVRQQKLSFTVNGLLYDKVYVQKGDTVRKGQLLVSLEQGGLSSDEERQQASIDALELQLLQQIEKRQLEMDRYQIQLSYMDEEQLEDAQSMDDHLRSYDRSINDTQNQLVLAKQQLGALTDSIRERRLYAGMDGTVTFLRSFKQTDYSNVTDTVVILSDSSSSMFVVDTSMPENFPTGLEVTVSMGQTDYPCVVMDAAHVGGEIDGEKAYLMTDLPTVELSDGDNGYLMLELGRKDDVLYVNTKAIRTMDGKNFVYVQDENGLRSMVEVTTGFTAGGNTEITSGLSQGDAVILK